MKRLLSLILGICLVFGVGLFVFNQKTEAIEILPEADCPAAPAVAAMLLEQAEIPNRYGSGKTGGNYISDVADHMGLQSDFDGVSKCETWDYMVAVADYLNNYLLPEGQEVSYLDNILLSVVYEGTCYLFGSDVNDTLTLTFLYDVSPSSTEAKWLYFEDANPLGANVPIWAFSNNVITITPGRVFNDMRPRVGDYIVEIDGVIDPMGRDAKVPDGGVEVTYSTIYGLDILDPVASYAEATNNYDGTITFNINAINICGTGVEGLDVGLGGNFYVSDSVLGGTHYLGTSNVPTTEEFDYSNGTYAFTLYRNYFNSRPAGYNDGWYRIWDVYVNNQLVEQNLELKSTYYSAGNWIMDLYTSTLHERFVVIETHLGGEINGFFGVGYDPEGVATGTITGNIVGNTIYMFYERPTEYNYSAEFWGTIASDGNSMSGTWTSGTWYMERE